MPDIVYIIPTGVLGNCPLCSGNLKRKGDQLECENGDYIVPEFEFNRIWDLYPAEKLKANEPAAGESLLRKLIEANIK